MQNRRNYYRVLQVQPDAPVEVIKSSYRTLMQKLRMHPDLGGDHANATLINEAYTVLSNPSKRQHYDKQILDELIQRYEHQPEPDVTRTQRRCLFCRTIYYDTQSRFCGVCHSPLDREATPLQSTKRTLGRQQRREIVYYYTQWPQHPFIAKLQDITPCGMGMIAEHALRPGQVIKIQNTHFNAIAEVKHCQAQQQYHVLGLAFLSVIFNQEQGGFVKTDV